MANRTWYVVCHIDHKYSVQDNPNGGGYLLDVTFDPTSAREAALVCAAANDALRVEREVAAMVARNG